MNIWLVIKNIRMSLSDFFGLISSITIWGFPLDTTLHIVVGFLVTFIGLRLKFSFLRVFIFLLIIESIKATFAAMTIEYSFLHGMKEFFATFIYPAFVWFVRKIKSSQTKTQ
ncbi:MAG: hypothetical protein H7281_17685 [Bacteriovorax sp.]|nr:hypothetical protein [Bacteriovorax sp.]